MFLIRIPKDKLIKTYPTKSEYTIVIKQLKADKFNGYLLVNTPIDGIDAKGYLVFEEGVPIFAYYEHKDVLKGDHSIKMSAANFTNNDSILEFHELSKHQIDICKLYINCMNDTGAKINEIDINKKFELPISSKEDFCDKINSVPNKSICNLCNDQCVSSIADPERLSLENKSVVLDIINSINVNSEEELEAFLKEKIRSFKEQSSVMLDCMGLGHMKKVK
ncbi:MAG: hypothetical protein K0A90_08385 [Methanosarcinaceae archaeon]|nr:hypothetical protein [Methanosarcinaceae archaeon]